MSKILAGFLYLLFYINYKLLSSRIKPYNYFNYYLVRKNVNLQRVIREITNCVCLEQFEFNSTSFLWAFQKNPILFQSPPLNIRKSQLYFFFLFKCHTQSSIGDYYEEYPLHCNFPREIFHRGVFPLPSPNCISEISIQFQKTSIVFQEMSIF